MPDEIQEEAVPQEEAPQTEEPSAEAAPVEEPQTETRENARVRDLVDDNKRLKQEFDNFRNQQLANYPNAAGQQFNQPQPVFDSETDANVRRVIAPERAAVEHQMSNVNAKLLEIDLRNSNTDFNDLLPDFQEAFQLAKEEYADRLEETLLDDAAAHKLNPIERIFALKAHKRDKYGDNITVNQNVRQLTITVSRDDDSRD